MFWSSIRCIDTQQPHGQNTFCFVFLKIRFFFCHLINEKMNIFTRKVNWRQFNSTSLMPYLFGKTAFNRNRPRAGPGSCNTEDVRWVAAWPGTGIVSVSSGLEVIYKYFHVNQPQHTLTQRSTCWVAWCHSWFTCAVHVQVSQRG